MVDHRLKGQSMRTTTLISSLLALLSLSLPAYAGRPAIFYVADPAALNVCEQMVIEVVVAGGVFLIDREFPVFDKSTVTKTTSSSVVLSVKPGSRVSTREMHL